ncbi:MAG: aspartate--tRNA ligase [Flavobacteriales bacterium]|nr:aspartate--tRNA ligase [Flavobacteriales bacterium]
MYRTHTCGELRQNNAGETVRLAGWVQRTRDLGGMTFLDLRDRYGITQLTFSMDEQPELCKKARKLGREYVIQIEGKVRERSSKNRQIPTGEIEIEVSSITILNASQTPPFTIEEESDGGDELRMKYRYLDLRRPPLRENMILRHKAALATRNYLASLEFMEIETPFLIKSTPEGARDFVVPSRLHSGEFYALPQSPQTFKQLLMVSGYDKYFQIVRCFRDEDLRADRQPEFTQIDCEMSFVTREDVIQTFEGLAKHLVKEIKGIEIGSIPQISYDDAMRYYGCDKPDIRFDMQFVTLQSRKENIQHIQPNHGFKVFEEAEAVIGICVKGAAEYTRKQLDELTDFVKRPQIGANGLIYVRYAADDTFKSSVDKFFNADTLKNWATHFSAQPGDLLLIMAGELDKTRKQLSELRLEMGTRLGLRKKDEFKFLWVLDFPMFEFNEEDNRWYAMHHPFTSPKEQDMAALSSHPESVKANAYDLVLNGSEIAGGSIRIHRREIQEIVFDILGFSRDDAKEKFGFLMNAFEYGAPPHGGIAFGFDRFCALLGGYDSIRDFIAFPKNNAGRDTMIDSPSEIDSNQWDELHIKQNKSNS